MKRIKFKALDELNEIIEYITEYKKVKYKATILFDCEIIKDALTTKSKKEQAFDIAVKKGVDFTILLGSKTFNEYNETIYEEYRIKEMLLTEEEFDLLKGYDEKCLKN